MKVIIFYSWQSQTQPKYNRYFIKECLEKVIKNLNKDPNFKEIDFELQEGIEGEPGTPSVAQLILQERIPSSNVFVADLTIANLPDLSSLPSEIAEQVRQSIRPSPNSNVLMEYGVALNSLGNESLIGVLNAFYGSPFEDPETLPFDLRHLRFPIQYDLSDTNKDNKSSIKETLTSDLYKAISASALASLKRVRERLKPMWSLDVWKSNTSITTQFIPNDKSNQILKSIAEIISNPKRSIRILGLSGMGKTRVLLESFLTLNKSDETALLSQRVLYVDLNHHSDLQIDKFLDDLISDNENRVLIVDNCSHKIHKGLMFRVSQSENSNTVITVDSNPEENDLNPIPGVDYILIEKTDQTNTVDKILEQDFSFLNSSELDRVKSFSQGIPLMAVLLGESIKLGKSDFGKLEDSELVDKLLGPHGKNERTRDILMACSLFSHFGYLDELRPQLEFIATNKNVCSITGEDQVIINDFDKVCIDLLDRGIFEKKGRKLGMRPFPLALYLAQQWLRSCSPPRFLKVINDIAQLDEPHRTMLSEAFAEQMKYLGYDEKAVQIVDLLVGPNSPFDNAEVLNTELGSRLFRSFVQVNPTAIANNLTRNFLSLSTEELLRVDRGRRNLVWVLETVCFDKRTFSTAVKVLYAFAVAENEKWSNNSRGQFLHLFNIMLAGTEVNLNERWKIVEWGLNQKVESYTELALQAMSIGLKSRNFHRTIGAEHQGTKKLEDYRPEWTEVQEYWDKILVELTKIALSKSKYSSLAAEIIANRIRSLVDGGMADKLLPIINDIAESSDFYWDDALIELKRTKRFEKNALSPSNLESINNLIDNLTRKDFRTKYRNASSYSVTDGDSYSSENTLRFVKDLAREFVENELDWGEYAELIFGEGIMFPYEFGQTLFLRLFKKDKNQIDEFIDLAFETLAKVEEEKRNLSLFAGFIAGLPQSDKNDLYERFENSEELRNALFYLVSVDVNAHQYLSMLFDLVDNKGCDINYFENLQYGKLLEVLSEEDLKSLIDRLVSYEHIGAQVAFELLFSLLYFDKKPKGDLIPLLESCVLLIDMSIEGWQRIDRYKWSKAITEILTDKTKREFAHRLNEKIIDSITIENSYHLDFDMQLIYRTLLTDFFDDIWPKLSKALLSQGEQYFIYYGLKHILGSHIGGVSRNSGVLFEAEADILFDWCRENVPLAPSRLAELAPIFGNDNTDFSTIHPITKRLLDEFGEHDSVLSNLSSNMGTFSWTGSLVPYLKAKKELFNSLIDHPKIKVINWAQTNIGYLDIDIKNEKNRDEEMY